MVGCVICHILSPETWICIPFLTKSQEWFVFKLLTLVNEHKRKIVGYNCWSLSDPSNHPHHPPADTSGASKSNTTASKIEPDRHWPGCYMWRNGSENWLVWVRDKSLTRLILDAGYFDLLILTFNASLYWPTTSDLLRSCSYLCYGIQNILAYLGKLHHLS